MRIVRVRNGGRVSEAECEIFRTTCSFDKERRKPRNHRGFSPAQAKRREIALSAFLVNHWVALFRYSIKGSPETTLLRKLSLPNKESARRALLLMRFHESGQLFDASWRNKESASHANESTLSQSKLLTTRKFIRWHARPVNSNSTKREIAAKSRFKLVVTVGL